jgi:CheY-like chemotaxis protein
MAQKRIVVVDDSRDNLDSLCTVLRTWGYEVDAAEDGTRALALALTRRTDIVVMDLGLPDGDALDVIRRIKTEDDAIIVVAFTGWQDLETAARAAGADAFVLKPDLESLERLLTYRRGAAAQRGPLAAKKTG